MIVPEFTINIELKKTFTPHQRAARKGHIIRATRNALREWIELDFTSNDNLPIHQSVHG